MDFINFSNPILMVKHQWMEFFLGILFALIAYGMALQWGVMNIINIAQGDLVILVVTLHTLCIFMEFILHGE